MRIQHKLFIAFLLAGISLVSLMFILMQWSLTKGLLEFINTKERDNIAPFVEVLKQRYQQQNNWRWLDGRHRLFHNLFRDNTVDKSQHFRRPAFDDRRPPPRQRQEGRPKSEQGTEPLRGQRKKQDNFKPRFDPPPRRNGGSGGPNSPRDLTLFDFNKQFVVGKPDIAKDDYWLSIKIGDDIIGWLVGDPHASWYYTRL